MTRSAENRTEKFLSKSTAKCDLSFLKPKPQPKQLVNSLKDEPWRFWKTLIRQKKNTLKQSRKKSPKKTTSFRCIPPPDLKSTSKKKSTWQPKHHSGSITLVSSIRAYHQAAIRPDPRVPFLRKNSPKKLPFLRIKDEYSILSFLNHLKIPPWFFPGKELLDSLEALLKI